MNNIYPIRKWLALYIMLQGSQFVKAQCSADFTFQQDPCSPKIVLFSSTTSLAQSLDWDFGNGVHSNNSSVAVQYSSFGTYTVSLTATYADGCINTHTALVTLYLQQDDELIATRDSSLCNGDSIFLHTSANPASFCRYTSAGPITTSAPDIYVNPQTNSTYYLISQQPENQVVNSDFSAGNTGFTSDYYYCNSPFCMNEDNYAVGIDPHFYHEDFRGYDHTTGSGNFLIANGATLPDIPVWRETLMITPNTDYHFSTWLCTLAGEFAPAQLQLLINGFPVGATVTAPSELYTWIQHSVTWNSGPAITAELSIAAKSDWRLGNDFGLDDIYFGTPAPTFRTDSININVTPLPELRVHENVINLCRGDIGHLNVASNVSALSWSPVIYLDTPSAPQPVINGLDTTTTFYIQALNGNCMQKDSVLVIVHNKPQVALNAPRETCRGTASMLIGEVSNAGYWTWSPLVGIADTASLKTAATPDSTVVYTLSAFNEYCSDSASVKLTVHQLPFITAGKTNDIGCGHATAKLTASGGSRYNWYPAGEVQNRIEGREIVVTPEQTRVYIVEGTDANGCMAKRSITVTVYGTGEVYVPNAFTPNRDGLNDIFRPIFKTTPSRYECKIFNRLGEIVFSSADPAKGWDGTHKSASPQSGVYTYIIKVENSCGPDVVKGSVVLIL